MEKVFQGKRAAVIGGTGGIGLALTLALAEAGASVVAVGREGSPGANSLASVSSVELVKLNLDIPQNRDIILASIACSDILCVVRGPFLQKSLLETSPDEWELMARTNLAFPGALVSAVLPHMISAKWGRIVLFGGTRTDRIQGFQTNAAYAAAKTGLAVLARSVAEEYGKAGVTCNVVCPGFTDTEYLDLEQKEQLARKNPDGKMISVQEIAETAFFLLKNSSINGVVLPVDKGWTPKLI